MKPILVLYATREGHTQRIAEHLAAAIGARGLSAELVDVAHIPAGFSVDAYSAAVVAASVHRGRHEREIIDFVKRHVHELERIPTAFLSVSLSEAGAEDATVPPERRAQAAADVEKISSLSYRDRLAPGENQSRGWSASLYEVQLLTTLCDETHRAASGSHNRHVEGP